MDVASPEPTTRLFHELSFAQRAVWLDVQTGASRAAYQLGTLCDIAAPIDADLARQATTLLMARHEALRLRVDDSAPRQWIERAPPPPLRVVDLSAAPDPDAACRAFVRDALAAGWQLGDHALFSIDLIRRGPQDSSLLLLCHHLIGDSASIGIALGQWLSIYRGLASDAVAELPPASSVTKLIEDDLAYESSARFADALAHWSRRLANPPELLFGSANTTEMPPARPLRWTIDGIGHAQLLAGCTRAGVSPQRALVALLAAALGRRYGRAALTIGMALHRRDAANRHVIGMLAGMIAAVCETDPDASLLQIVRGFGRQLDEDMRHHRLPIDALMRALGRRDALFDVAVSFSPAAWEGSAGRFGEAIVQSHALRGAETSPLALYVAERDGALDFALCFHPARIAPQEAACLGTLIQRVIIRFGEAPSTRLSALDTLMPEERALIEGFWRGAVVRYPIDTLHALIAAQAARTPDALAVIGAEGALSYAELQAQAGAMAAGLAARGVVPGAVVGILLPRSVQSVVAALAVLRAGAVYLPLDPAYPAARLAFMAEDAGAALVVHADDLDSSAGNSVALGDLATGRPPLNVDMPPEALAYIIYTSGSTGQPKGVAMPHAAAANLAFARHGHDPIGPGDRILAAISVGFDVSIGQLLLPLASGAAVVVAPDLRTLSAEDFWAFLAGHAVTHINSVPSVFDSVLHAAPAATTLRRLMLGGERLSAAMVGRLRAALPGVPVVNMYGPTETCIDATAYVVPDDITGDALPIGRPLPNYTACILDEELNPVGIGVPGELCIGGAGIAQGYVNRPDLTADRFVPDPSGAPGERLYRTGDLAAWREDGNIAFLGRADAQIKIRGFRVEPGEIEAALTADPAVAQAAVIARDGRLLAYVVAAAGQAIDVQAIRAGLAAKLPDHMVPAGIAVLAALPLTRNGKLDEKALPPIDADGGSAGRLPAPGTETTLARIVATLLDVPRVHAEDDFFALGGHSLLAARLVSRIRTECGVALPLRAVFEHPGIAALAAEIDAASGDGPAAGPVLAVRPHAIPLSHAQEGFWFLDRFGSGDAYNIPMPFLLEGDFDLAAADHALRRLIARQSALRTVVVPSANDAPATQICLPPERFAPRTLDLRGQDQAALTAQLAALATHRFDLTAEPPILACFIMLDAAGGKARHALMAVVHHSVFDGWSAGIFFSELATIYQAASQGCPDPLPPLAWHYADVALWQRSQSTDDGLAYWVARLHDAPALLGLPTDSPRGPSGGPGGVHEIAWPATLRIALIDRARESGASLFMLLHAAFAILLSRWCGQRDLVIGTSVANRPWQAWDKVIGCFVNTLALRLEIRPAETFAALLTRTRDADLEALEHQDIPLDRIVDAINPERSPLHAPLVQVLLVLQNNAMPRPVFPGVTVTPLPVPPTDAKLDLALNLTEQPDGTITGSIDYAAALFRPATIARLAQRLRTVLEAAAADPHQPIAKLDTLMPEERALIEGFWRGAVVRYPIDTLHALIAAQAARTPDALAVIGAEGALSYAELQAQAGAMAAGLAARGVVPGAVVGILLPRSVQSVVAALAVLRAGAVYLPLDPAYPAARLAFMAEDAGAALVVHADDLDWSAGNSVALGDLATGRPPLNVDMPPEALAYIIYTSGSTGQPKGVAMPHAAAANLAFARHGHDPIGPGDRILAAISVGFDVSIGQLLLPLASGAAVVVAPDLRTLSAEDFWAFLAGHAVTHINSVPSVFDSVLHAAPAATTLRRLMLGGERLSAAMVGRLRAALPGVPVVNMYGPTETCIDATAYVVPDDITGDALPIGRPLPNYTACILDEELNPVGIGVPGELCIGGAGVAQGYVNRPDLTADRFVPDPSGAPGERLYRTGDLAAWREDGNIAFLGRADAQIKIRGFRVEPGEIEAALTADPAVAQAAVIARDGRLLAYVVAAAGQAIDVQAIRAGLAAKLPDHMVPAGIAVLAALPLTRNGKLDEKALPPIDEAPKTAARAPRDDHERLLLRAWQGVMGNPAISVDDDFFALGGHSLLALRLITACGEALGLSLPVRLLLEAPTVATMAACIQSGAAGGRSNGLLRLRPGDAGTAVFLVHPIGGNAVGYGSLAAALPAGPAIFGLQAEGLEAGETLAPDLPSMAARYIAAIRSVQPSGPYRILGVSFGGVVAFEMGRQLVAAGDTVGLIGLLDSTPPGATESGDTEADLAGALLREYGWQAHLPEGECPTLDALLNGLQMAGLVTGDAALARAQRLIAVLRNNIALNSSYAPLPFQDQGPTMLVRALRRLVGGRALPDWSGLIAPPPILVDFDCDHVDLLTPALAGPLAAALAPFL